MAALPAEPEPSPAPASCAQRIEAAIRGDAAPMPDVMARVAMLLAAKGEPAFFVRQPREGDADVASRSYRRHLERSRFPRDVLKRWLPQFAQNPALGRKVLLTEGYLWAGSPDHGHALVDLVQAHHLYREPRIWVQRGTRLVFAEREPQGPYRVTQGEDRGKPLRLLLYDRIGIGAPPAPLHRDFRELRYRLHFERATVRFADRRYVVADLRYGAQWVRTLLSSDGARLELECEVDAPSEARLREARAANRDRTAAVQVLRRIILEQIDEGILFDEPMTEIGQQDGRLRPGWRFAYLAGRSSYRFMGDRYPVFDRLGRPVPPQVCIDFLLDTWERASGTWWRSADSPRGRTAGLLDWDDHGGFALRPAAHFVDFVERHPDWFELQSPPESERFGIGNLARLARYLLAHADEYQPGDMVLIHGWTPWDRRERHYHSFFVYETDPLTGVPISIAGNAGRPSLRTWRVESVRTPERLVAHRARPRSAWLIRVVPRGAVGAPTPPPLSAEAEPPLPLAIPLRR